MPRKILTVFVPVLMLFASQLSASVPFIPVSEIQSESVPVPSRGVPDMDYLLSDYEDVHSALKYYSEIAYLYPQGTQEFIEASIFGQYLRGRLQAIENVLLELTGLGCPGFGASRSVGTVSMRMMAELDSVFKNDEDLTQLRGVGRSVNVKSGYCRINYVKNNTPFLAQSDAFLNKGEVILTFDDGPGPLSDELSYALNEAGAPSVFFVLGARLGENGKRLIKRENEDGHSVSVHGYHHATESGKPFTALSEGEAVRQVGTVASSIYSAVGARPRFFRPPYGIISAESLRKIYSEFGLVPVGWTIDTLDWAMKDPEQLFEKTTSLLRQRGKGILLLHDIHPQSRIVAVRLVKWLKGNGYKVVSPEKLAEAFKSE